MVAGCPRVVALHLGHGAVALLDHLVQFVLVIDTVVWCGPRVNLDVPFLSNKLAFQVGRDRR